MAYGSDRSRYYEVQGTGCRITPSRTRVYTHVHVHTCAHVHTRAHTCTCSGQAVPGPTSYFLLTNAQVKRAVEDKNLGPLVKTSMTRCIHCTVSEIYACYLHDDPLHPLHGERDICMLFA